VSLGEYRLLGPQAPLFLGGATSLCLHLLRKLGGTHILNCTLAAIALVHQKFISLSQNYHITIGYVSLCVCFGMCFFNVFPLHLLVGFWADSPKITSSPPDLLEGTEDLPAPDSEELGGLQWSRLSLPDREDQDGNDGICRDWFFKFQHVSTC